MVADQDSVRLLAVEGCAALGKLLEPADCVANVLPVIVSFSQVGFCWPSFQHLTFFRLFLSDRSHMAFPSAIGYKLCLADEALNNVVGIYWNDVLRLLFVPH